jgi:diguanylate cyclase (GGDEF)-like protein
MESRAPEPVSPLFGTPDELSVLDENTLQDPSGLFRLPLLPRGHRLQLRVLTGREKGRCIPLSCGTVTLGRDPRCDVILENHGVSRRHCELRVHDDHTVELRDLGSTNGTRLSGAPVADRFVPMADGAQLQLTRELVLELGTASAASTRLFADLYEKAVRDPLTGLYNKRVLLERLDEELAMAQRSARPLSLLVIDIDHFKGINDRWGHATGDEVLQGVGAVLAEALRIEDLAARYGGEEFVVLLRDTTEALARRVGERMREAIGELRFPVGSETVRVTASVGLATSAEPGIRGAGALFERADQRLYAAKRGGRDRLVGPQAA